jgi:hypothetical protein
VVVTPAPAGWLLLHRHPARHKPSEDFYVRKRGESKTHHQAIIALARKRVNVLWAMLRDGQPYREQRPEAA